MNIRKLLSYKKYLLASCAGVVLCSCQSALYSAAERGDVALARQAIAKGTTPLQLNEAADIAYAKGHTAVLDELAKAGAAVAPKFMAGKMLVLQTDKMGETNTSELNAPEALWTPDALSPASYWVPVNWVAPGQDEDCRLRELVWTSGQENKFDIETSDAEHTDEVSRSYVRINRNNAVAYERKSSIYNGALWTAWRGWHKYELVFETPTSGHFYGYECSKLCNVYQLRGRFWVKDAPAEPEKKPEQAKKQGKKKKGKR